MELHDLADLHIHLGATISPDFLWELAHRQGIRLHEKNYWKFIDLVTIRKKIPSKNYLKKLHTEKDEEISPFELTHKIQSSPMAVEECVHRAIAEAYRTMGMDLVEIRFNPMFRNRGGEHDLDKVILGAVTGLKRACLEYPIKAGLIFETDRQFTQEQHLVIAKKAIEFKGFGVVGFDVSGPSPDDFKIDNLIESSQMIKDAGLGMTIHTGEVTGPEEIWEIIEKLKPNRIGHGIKAVKDSDVMRKIASENIVLELCPTSNIRTEVVKDWNECNTIIQELKNHNVLFTINSDGPEFLDTNIEKEYLSLMENGILTEEEIKSIINLSHERSFI